MAEQIGIVTGGGDCPGLNAVIRAVVKAGTRRGWGALGILGGYEGLLDPVQCLNLQYPTVSEEQKQALALAAEELRNEDGASGPPVQMAEAVPVDGDGQAEGGKKKKGKKRRK